MMKRLLPAIPFLEMGAAYAALFGLLFHRLDRPLLVIAFVATGILFALFYHYRGIFTGCLAFIVALLRANDWSIVNFTGEDYVILVIGLGIIYAVGAVRWAMQSSIALLHQKGDLLEERATGILSELISFEVSHRVFLEDMYFRLDDPIYIYHELRKQCLGIEEETEFFGQLFKVLNRYLFVEKGVAYRNKGGRFESMFRFGQSELPETVERGAQPAHFQLMTQTRKIVFSRFPERHGFLIVIPIPSLLDEEVAFAIVIEKIRFIMLNPRTSMNLKAVSLMIKQIFEKKFSHKQLRAYSVTQRAHVFNEATSLRILPERLHFLKETGIGHCIVVVDLPPGQEALEAAANQMELALRLLDDKYMLDGKLHAVLLFTDHVPPIISRLVAAGLTPGSIREVDHASFLSSLSRPRQ